MFAETQSKQSALLPLSGKKRLDSIDQEIVLRDRVALDAIVNIILEDKRLASFIADTWLEMNGYVKIKKEDYDYLECITQIAERYNFEQTAKNKKK